MLPCSADDCNERSGEGSNIYHSKGFWKLLSICFQSLWQHIWQILDEILDEKAKQNMVR